MTDAETSDSRLGLKRVLLMFAAYLALVVATSWPIAAHLADRTPATSADPRLTSWIIAWEARVLPSNPTKVFQAPYYWPEPDTLALTDHQLGLAPVAVPVMWLTGNAYVAHNVTILLSLAFACTAAALLGREVTGSTAAGFVAGAAYGLAPYWGDQITHIQIVCSGWVPMAMFGLVRWSRAWRPRWIALSAASAVMATLTSYYQGTFVAIGLGVAGIALLITRRPPNLRPVVHAAVAAVLAAGALVPFTLPYTRIGERDPNFKRTIDEVAPFSARPRWFLAAPRDNLLLGDATTRFRKPNNDEASLYPGLAIVALSVAGLVTARRHSAFRPALAAGVAVLVTGVLLSAGIGGRGVLRLPWEPLSVVVPPLRALRAASRAHVLTVLGLSMLAGLGAVAMLGRLRRSVRVIALASALVLLVAVEGATAPRKLGPAPRPERIYEMIASRPGPVLEFPVRPPTGVESTRHGLEVDAMMRATAHWQPLVQGYAGYYPPRYTALIRALARFPDRPGLDAIRAMGIRTLVVRLDTVRPLIRDQVDERMKTLPGVTLLAREGPVAVYDVGVSAR